MSNTEIIEQSQSLSVIASLATHYGMDKAAFLATIKATVMNGANVSNEQVAAFCLVAKEHKLNPFTKEIFAFPSRGGIVPVVSVDGWMKLINSHPDFDGMEFKDVLNEAGSLVSITCRMFRKNHSHPVEVTEYMSECLRNTDVWKTWPARMLRHKAAIQAARYAFGFAGIMEQDEAERMVTVTQTDDVSGGNASIRIEDTRKARHDEAAEQYSMSIQCIKDKIAEWDETQDEDCLYTVAEAWGEIPSAAQMDLWLAPKKGGVWTTHERDTIKTKLPRKAA